MTHIEGAEVSASVKFTVKMVQLLMSVICYKREMLLMAAEF